MTSQVNAYREMKFQSLRQRKPQDEATVPPLKDASTRLRLWILAALFASLTAVGAWLKVPLPTGVPLSLQTFFVLLAGGVLGARYGALSQLLYLATGLLGAPVFAEGGGLAYIVRPTFGYLLSYPAAALIVGLLVQRLSSSAPKFWAFALANGTAAVAVLLFGVGYLYVHLRYFAASPLPLKGVLWAGAIVFLPGELLKVLLAAELQVRLRPALARQVGGIVRF